MKDLLDNAPRIIAEAAKSPLGIVALLILAGSTLAWLFFGESPDLIKVGVFIFIFLSFIFLTRISFDHSRETKTREAHNEPIPTFKEEIEGEPPADDGIEVSEIFEWIDPNDKCNKHELTRAELDILDVLKGKPDVRWSAELIKGSVLTRSMTSESDLDVGLSSLVRKGYLRQNADSVFAVLPLAVEYYRATEALPIHEIDEADYWDGT